MLIFYKNNLNKERKNKIRLNIVWLLMRFRGNKT